MVTSMEDFVCIQREVNIFKKSTSDRIVRSVLKRISRVVGNFT
jgi:hypothetical protein